MYFSVVGQLQLVTFMCPSNILDDPPQISGSGHFNNKTFAVIEGNALLFGCIIGLVAKAFHSKETDSLHKDKTAMKS